MTTIGSLFSGYRGLDAAVESVTGGHTVWHSDVDPGACKILAHHWPDTPNLGDISAVDWSQVEPVDIITGGFPCQDVSMAGRRAGLTAGTRSGLWAMMADAINHLRPSLVVIENVRGLLSAAADSDVEPCPWCVGDVSGEPPLRALGAVLGDLADIGYDAAWHGLTAASVGAPHGRFRVFIVAWPADAGREYGERWSAAVGGSVGARGSSGQPERPAETAADADEIGRHGWSGELRPGRWGEPADSGDLPADTAVSGDTPSPDTDCCAGVGNVTGSTSSLRASNGVGHGSARHKPAADTDCGERDGRKQVPQRVEVGRAAPAGAGADVRWGQFEPAIRRWERLTRPAPAPTEASSRGGQRLSPRFVEWMQGLPEGHVTAVPGLSRNEQLKALGNGVVPQQAEAALRVLLNAVVVAA